MITKHPALHKNRGREGKGPPRPNRFTIGTVRDYNLYQLTSWCTDSHRYNSFINRLSGMLGVVVVQQLPRNTLETKDQTKHLLGQK